MGLCRAVRANNTKIYNDGRCPIGRELRNKRGKIRWRGRIILQCYFFTHARARITYIVNSYIYIYHIRVYIRSTGAKITQKLYTDGRGMRLLHV